MRVSVFIRGVSTNNKDFQLFLEILFRLDYKLFDQISIPMP